MKKINLIKRLWVDSHEKHLPQRFGHYAAMLFLFLTLGVGQMWGDVTVYVTGKIYSDAWIAEQSEVRINYNSSNGWSDGPQIMEKLDYTYNGYPIYKYTISTANGICVQFAHYKNGERQGNDVYNTGTGDWYYQGSDYNGKLFLGWNGSTHVWVDFCCDMTVYWANTSDQVGDVKAYAYGNGENSSWSGADMNSTGKKYQGHDIYSITFTNPPFPYVIFNVGGDSHKTGDLRLDAEKGGKMYLGTNGGWVTYQYDVTLDMQSGTGGTNSITATCGSAMPGSKTAPTRTGYIFDGYYTETNGSGTKYYNADMTSANTWPADGSGLTRLYAKWIPITISEASMDPDEISPSTPTNITFSFKTNAPTGSGYKFRIKELTPSASSYGAGYEANDETLTATSPTAQTYERTAVSKTAGTYKTQIELYKDTWSIATSDITLTVGSGGGGGGSTWYWIDGNGAHNGSEGGITTAEFTETATAGVYTLTRELTKDQNFHLGDGSKGYGPQTPANGDHTDVTATSSNINLAEYGAVYWFTFTPATQQVMMTLNTNASPMTLSFANPTYTITYKDKDNVTYSGTNGGSLPNSYTYGTGIATLTAGVKAGYKFDGWYENSSCTGDAVTTIGTTATGTKTFYAKWSHPAITALSASAADVYSGEGSITLTATRNSDATGINIQYQVKVPGGSWTNIGEAVNSTTQSYSPTAGDGTYEFRAYPVGYESNSESTTKRVYEHWNIYVHDVQGWGKMDIYSYTDEAHGTWPGTSCSTYNGTSSWYTVTLDSKGTKFILNKHGEQTESSDVKTTDLTTGTSSGKYAAGTYWYIDNFKGGSLQSVTVSDPTVVISSFTVINTKQIKVIGNITNCGGDGTAASDMKEVGFKIGETKYSASCLDGTSFTRYITGLTAGTTYSVKAYAENVHGTGESSSQSITTRAAGTTTIKVRTGHGRTAPQVYAYTDETAAGCNGAKTENAAWPGEAMTKIITGTTYDWYTYNLSNEFNNFIVSETGNADKTDDFANPFEDKCYWYKATEGTQSSRMGEMSCPYLTPQLMIETTAGSGAYTYHEMTSSPSISKTISLAANSTYKFKPIYNSEWYGKASTTLTRASNSASSLSASDETNLQITTDVAGDYTFTFTAPNTIEVTFPEAYAVTHGEYAGTASLGSYTVSPSITSGRYVADGEDVTFTATPNLGYKTEWYDNSGCTGVPIGTGNTYTISSIDAPKTVYAKYVVRDLYIHADFVSNWGTPAQLTQNDANKAIYAYSIDAMGERASAQDGGAWNTGYHFRIMNAANGGDGYLAYNYDGVQTPTYSGSSIDGVHKTADGNPTIEFGLTTKSDVTITLTLQSADDATKPTVNITAHPYYNVTFNAGSGTCATANKEVVYGKAYGALPVATPPGADSFVGWFTESVGGEQVTAETIVDSDVAHNLFAHYESTYIVTIQFKCGSVVLYPQTTTSASATTIAAAIAAPEIIGYRFNNWTQSDSYVTFEDDDVAETTIHATGATTITANYTAVPTVYFKNNLGWENVYVTFDAYFGEAGGATVPGQNGKPYYKMTQLGSTDVYYCVIPDAVNASWKWNIAFDNKGFTYDEDTHIGSYGYFYQGEFIGRGDFDPDLTMYIPYNGDTETRNSGTYYRTGCWMKYNSTDPGYKIYANTYVEGEGGEAVDGTPVLLTADVAGGYEFKGKVNFPLADYSYGFMLHKEANTNTKDRWYTNNGAIYATTTTLPWDFSAEGASENGQRCEIHTEAIGEYEFTVSFGTGRPVVNVEYPVGVGDWKLIYKDRAAWSGAVHTAAWQHPSRVIKAKASTEDIVSFFVSKATGANATIELYKCTAINSTTGEETWTKQSDVNLSGITETGIYNFKVTQDADKNATVTFDGGYTGNFYIRTDASDGGWSNYKTSGTNTMTYSEYAESQTADKRFSHYFMRYVNNGQNIKFCIANDYSECISDTLVSDTYTNEWLEANANIRFMWYHATNKISRAYLAGSSNVADRFLVLEGDEKLYDADGNSLTGTHQISGLNEHEMKFTDDQNWVYEATVKAKPTAPIKLTAKFNDKVQYFYGTESTTYQLIGGTGDTQYKIRVVYDFKTNRLVAAWLPDGTSVSDPFPINADIMIIRSHQGDAQQITFSDDGKLTDVKTVYGAMRFNKYRLNNQSEAAGHSSLGLSQYERDLYFISFPFEVKLNEVFGFGTYGKHWIIEYYDGKGRAQNGFWADSPTNWKFVTPQMKNTFTLEANQGYVLALDLEELTMSSSVWNYGVDSVYLYFPSSATVGAIQATTANVTIDQTGYQCTINRPYGSDGDRRVKDSYWHLLGVPSFANASHETGTSWTGSVPTTATPATWTADVPYIYNWEPNSNTLSVQTTSPMTFKAMYSYLAQYSATTINWTSVNAKPASVAARRLDGYKSVYELRLDLQQNGKEVDHTFVSLRDDEAVSANFDFNFDLSKMLYGAFSSKSNIYTLTGDAIEVAGNCLPLTEQTTIVPVGVTVGANGEYTFSLPDVSDDMSVTLIDNEYGTRTDLRLMDYDVNLTAGTYSDRFMLELRTARGAATDIESIEGGTIKDGKAHKFVRDGILYILRDGVIYDAMGKRVK